MLEDFEKFTKQGRSFNPKISIRKRGQIGFNNGAINRFRLEDYDFVVLYINKERNKIAFKFTSNPEDEGAVKIIKKKNNYFVSGKSFLDYYSIPYNETRPHDVEWNDEQKVAIIDIDGNPGDNEEHETSSEESEC